MQGFWLFVAGITPVICVGIVRVAKLYARYQDMTRTENERLFVRVGGRP